MKYVLFVVLLFGCASSPKMVDILTIPVPDGFKCEEHDNNRVLWVNENMLTMDAMDWYAKKSGFVRNQNNTGIFTHDGQKFHLSFGIWAMGGSSIEITRIHKGKSRIGDKIKDKKDETIDEIENEVLDTGKDILKRMILPW